MKPLPSETQAKKRLDPYHELLAQCHQQAWDQWRDQHESGFLDLKRRTRANVVHNLITDQVKQKFARVSGTHVLEEHGRVLLCIGDDLLLHFKKFSKDLKPSNYPTQLSLDFARQRTLGIIEDQVRLTVGYTLNHLEMDLEAVYISLFQGATREWCYELDLAAASLVTPITSAVPAPASSPEPRRSRIRRKVVIEKDDAEISVGVGEK